MKAVDNAENPSLFSHGAFIPLKIEKKLFDVEPLTSYLEIIKSFSGRKPAVGFWENIKISVVDPTLSFFKKIWDEWRAIVIGELNLNPKEKLIVKYFSMIEKITSEKLASTSLDMGDKRPPILKIALRILFHIDFE